MQQICSVSPSVQLVPMKYEIYLLVGTLVVLRDILALFPPCLEMSCTCKWRTCWTSCILSKSPEIWKCVLNLASWWKKLGIFISTFVRRGCTWHWRLTDCLRHQATPPRFRWPITDKRWMITEKSHNFCSDSSKYGEDWVKCVPTDEEHAQKNPKWWTGFSIQMGVAWICWICFIRGTRCAKTGINWPHGGAVG